MASLSFFPSPVFCALLFSCFFAAVYIAICNIAYGVFFPLGGMATSAVFVCVPVLCSARVLAYLLCNTIKYIIFIPKCPRYCDGKKTWGDGRPQQCHNFPVHIDKRLTIQRKYMEKIKPKR